MNVARETDASKNGRLGESGKKDSLGEKNDYRNLRFMEKPSDIQINDLYPDLSIDELKQAKENLDLYLEHTLRIFERIRKDPEASARLAALTGKATSLYDTGQKVDCSSKTNP